jgi:hypothetical protein
LDFSFKKVHNQAKDQGCHNGGRRFIVGVKEKKKTIVAKPKTLKL